VATVRASRSATVTSASAMGSAVRSEVAHTSTPVVNDVAWMPTSVDWTKVGAGAEVSSCALGSKERSAIEAPRCCEASSHA
jgi:hypothetical protein